MLASMPIRLNPYLSFQDSARDAMTFYQSVFGGEITVSTFADFGAGVEDDDGNKVMHSQLETPDGLTLMASDTPKHMEYRPQSGVSVSLSGEDEARLQGYWDQLSDGGTVVMPFEKAAWGDRFGMSWMVNAAGQS